MGLTLITGRANAGKTGELFAPLISSAQSGQPVLILPQRPDALRASREFAQRGVSGVRVAVFEDWIRDLWSAHGDGRRLVTPGVRTLIAGAAAQRVSPAELAMSSSTPGFVALVCDVIEKTPLPIHALGSGRSATSIGRILSEYFAEIDRRGLVEPSRATLLLTRLDLRLDGPAAFNRFTDLTYAQEALIQGLSVRNDVSLALTWQEGSAATEALTPVVTRLLGAGARHVTVTERAWTDPGLETLESGLFEDCCAPGAPPSLRMGLASGPEAECALIARHVSAALDRGVAPESIAVCFRDAGRRATLMAAALDAQGVDASFDVSVPFGMTQFGGAFCALLDALVGGDSARERLLGFLATPFSGMDPDAVATVDEMWRRKRVSPERYVSTAVPYAGLDSPLALGTQLGGAELQPRSVKLWQDVAKSMLKHGNARGALDGLAGVLNSAAHRGLLRTLEELVSAGETARATDLARALRALNVASGEEESPGGVVVTEAQRMRGRRFDMVVLGGLTAAEFSPERPVQLSEVLAAQLGQPSGADPRLMERLLFYMLVTRARRELVLIRQGADERGDALRASAFWDHVLDVYRTSEQATQGAWPPGLVVDRLSTADLVNAAPAFTAGRRELRARAPRTSPVAPARGRLSREDVLAEMAKRDEFSVSELEAYIRCPYGWFYGRAVNPREMDREFDSRERGSTTHRILATFYERWIGQGNERVDNGNLTDALSVLGEVSLEVVADARSRVIRDLKEELSADKATAWAQSVIRDDATLLPGFRPVAHEMRFGVRSGQPVTLWGVGLAGSIDRVDLGEAGLVVMDYKSSGTIQGKASFTTRGLIQVAVYSAVASAITENPVVCGVYRSLPTLACRGFWDPARIDLGYRATTADRTEADEIIALLEGVGERVKAAAEGIRSGCIEPRPLDSGACTYCRASSLCGRSR